MRGDEFLPLAECSRDQLGDSGGAGRTLRSGITRRGNSIGVKVWESFAGWRYEGEPGKTAGVVSDRRCEALMSDANRPHRGFMLGFC